MLYLDLEDRDDRNRLAEPALFLDNVEDRLVILDEIHRMPELFQTLRGVIDRGRRRGKGRGRFLVLGSASIDLLRQFGESLAGRIAYIDLLADLLLVRRLTSLRANVGKRLVKSPKVYVRDSGLVHALLGIESLEQLAGHPVIGGSWDGYVIESLASVLPPRATPYFYRTSAGAEVDLVIEHGDGERWAIEIKRSLSARVDRGFHIACEDMRPSRAFVVHAGDDRYPVSDNLEAIGVRGLATELRARS